jgi:hypothetical protein
MSAKHTPGPWVTGQHGGVIDRRGCAVAKVQEMPGQDCGEVEANASLLSAAPDMLAALEELLADKYLSDPINADRMAKARAAIAKAKGEA